MSSYHKTMRILRPLNQKMDAIRKYMVYFTDFKSYDLSGDIGINRSKYYMNKMEEMSDGKNDYSLIMETSTDQSYKDDDSESDSDFEDVYDERADHLFSMNLFKENFGTWETMNKRIPIDEWKFLDDLFSSFKYILENQFKGEKYNRSKLSLSEISALEIGIAIGMNSNTRSIEESKIKEIEDYIRNWYEHPVVQRYIEWVIVGHSIGIIFLNIQFLGNLVPYMMLWVKQYGLTKTFVELYLENRGLEDFLDDYSFFNNFCDVIVGQDLNSIALKHVLDKFNSVDVTYKKEWKVIHELITYNKREEYRICLDIICKEIHLNCEYLSQIPKLVETLRNFNQNQHLIISSLSKFVEIFQIEQVSLNLEVIGKIYLSLKLADFKSLIPILKIIKFLILDKNLELLKVQYLKLTKDAKRLLPKICKRSHSNCSKIYRIIKDRPLQELTLNSSQEAQKFSRDNIATGGNLI